MTRKTFQLDGGIVSRLLTSPGLYMVRRVYSDRRYENGRYHSIEHYNMYLDEIRTKCQKIMKIDTGSASTQKLIFDTPDSVFETFTREMICQLCVPKL
jgi:hypothetical protein